MLADLPKYFMNFYLARKILDNSTGPQRYVYEQWRGSSRTIANKYLPLEIPQEFPSRRGQAIVYTHCYTTFFIPILYFSAICLSKNIVMWSCIPKLVSSLISNAEIHISFPSSNSIRTS